MGRVSISGKLLRYTGNPPGNWWTAGSLESGGFFFRLLLHIVVTFGLGNLLTLQLVDFLMCQMEFSASRTGRIEFFTNSTSFQLIYRHMINVPANPRGVFCTHLNTFSLYTSLWHYLLLIKNFCTFQCFLKRNCPHAVPTIPLFLNSSLKKSEIQLITTSFGTENNRRIFRPACCVNCS